MASGAAPVTLIPSVGSMNEVSSRILGRASLLFKAYRLDLVGSDGSELLSMEGQLEWVLKAF
mgnify:CR=1 FL=1